jgi:hypothetical protein
MIDYRRTDERDNIRPNPFWVRSAKMEFGGKEGFNAIMDDNEAVFMSFPKGGKGPFPVVVMGVIVEILTAFVGGTPAIAIGNGTIPTYNSTDGDTVSVVSANSVMATAVVLPAVVGKKMAYPLLVPFILIPADTVTPVLQVALTSGSPITAGAIRINTLVSEAN